MRTISKAKRFLFGIWAASTVLSLHGQEVDADAQTDSQEAAKSGVSENYEEAIEKYGDKPVEATQIQGPSQFSPIVLVDLTVGGMVMRYPNLESPITIPEDELTFEVAYRPELDAELYSQLMEEGRTDEALELIRAEVYPLLKFVRADPQTVRIHGLITRLLDELIAAGYINEAASILESFPRDRLTGYFRTQAVQVASALAEEDEVERAYEMVQQFPLGPGQLDFVPVYLDLANEFRLRQEWERARNLYTDVQLASSPSATPEAFLWEAYIHLEEGRDFMVDGVLQEFGSVSPDNPYFPLREMIRGILFEKRGEKQQALSTMAKGLVYSTTNDPWTPELLYRTADLYEDHDRETAAAEIRDQLRFFYPDSVWTGRL